MTRFSDEDIEHAAASNGKPRKGGKLPLMPEWEAPLAEQRQWLNLAFNPRSGISFDTVTRHGRGLSDPVDVVFRGPSGGEVRYRFPEQRALAKPANLRSAISAITDGLCRPPHLTVPECGDVWTMLCTIAVVSVEQDPAEDFREDLERFMAVCEPETRFSLDQPWRYDTLVALRGRGTFERSHAQVMASQTDERQWSRRPVLLVDQQSGRRWIRVGELGTYMRHVIGMQLGRGMLDGRMAALGHHRIAFEERRGHEHPKAALYRLAGDESETDAKES